MMVEGQSIWVEELNTSYNFVMTIPTSSPHCQDREATSRLQYASCISSPTYVWTSAIDTFASMLANYMCHIHWVNNDCINRQIVPCPPQANTLHFQTLVWLFLLLFLPHSKMECFNQLILFFLKSLLHYLGPFWPGQIPECWALMVLGKPFQLPISLGCNNMDPQEEPLNNGAWTSVGPCILTTANKTQHHKGNYPYYAGHQPTSSVVTGSKVWTEFISLCLLTNIPHRFKTRKRFEEFLAAAFTKRWVVIWAIMAHDFPEVSQVVVLKVLFLVHHLILASKLAPSHQVPCPLLVFAGHTQHSLWCMPWSSTLWMPLCTSLLACRPSFMLTPIMPTLTSHPLVFNQLDATFCWHTPLHPPVLNPSDATPCQLNSWCALSCQHNVCWHSSLWLGHGYLYASCWLEGFQYISCMFRNLLTKWKHRATRWMLQ